MIVQAAVPGKETDDRISAVMFFGCLSIRVDAQQFNCKLPWPGPLIVVDTLKHVIERNLGWLEETSFSLIGATAL